jgi:hypothetical protein
MRTCEKIIVLAFLVLLAGVGGVSAGDNLFVGNPSNGGIIPTLINFNAQSCSEMGTGCSGSFYKIDKENEIETPTLYSGTYDLGNGNTIKITATEGTTIAWESNAGINCIFMKGGDGGDVYCYDPPVRSDSGLTTGKNKQGTLVGISHIDICYTPNTNVPEFPVGIIPVFIIGLIGLAGIIRKYR